MHTKEKAGRLESAPAGKQLGISRITELFRRRKAKNSSIKIAWHLVADLIVLQTSYQDSLAEYQQRLDAALVRLGELEANFWHARRGEEAEHEFYLP